MGRLSYVVLGLVLAFGLALYMMTRSSGSDEDTPAPSAFAPRAATPTTSADVTPLAERPTLPTMANPGTGTIAGTTRDYINSQGLEVRDHRGRDMPEYVIPSTDRPGHKQTVEPRVIAGVRASIYDSLRACRGVLESTSLGAKPRAQAEVIVSIQDGTLRADSTRTKFGDVPEEVGTKLGECMEVQLANMSFDASGHEDISEYRVTLVFPLGE